MNGMMIFPTLLMTQNINKAKLSYALANIHGHVRDKVRAGQTRNVVINLTDSICNPGQLGNHFFDNRIEHLRNIIILKPREDATPIKAYYSEEKTYGIYRPQDFTIKEYNIEKLDGIFSVMR